jgi:hypothetical protein
MLDHSQHDDRQDQLRGEEHLDEDALRDGRPTAEERVHVEIAREQGRRDPSGRYPGDELGHDDQQASHGWESTHQPER